MTGTPNNPALSPAPRLRVMDGATELAVAEAVAVSQTRPEAVTAVIAALFETIEDKPATRDSVRMLPSAAREWLLQWSAGRLHPGLHWFEGNCDGCGEPFDISLDLTSPVYRAAEPGVSTVTVGTSLGTRRFAVPTGEHEEGHALMPGTDPRRGFAGLCGLSGEAAAEALHFDEHDLQLIDEAIEAASPDIADEVSITCPSCKEETSGRIDPLQFAFPREADILREIHLIAGAYGWPLREILALKARQRGRYADMIVRERRAASGGRGR